MSASSRTLKNPWLLAMFGLWSLLAISFVAPFTVHAAAIVPMGTTPPPIVKTPPPIVKTPPPIVKTPPPIVKTPPPIVKTPPVDNSQPIFIRIRNATDSLMKFTGSSLSGTQPVDVKPNSVIAFYTQGTPGWATWTLNGAPNAPTIKVSWDGSDPWNSFDEWDGSVRGIVSIPQDAVQFGSSIVEENNDIQETFTVYPRE